MAGILDGLGLGQGDQGLGWLGALLNSIGQGGATAAGQSAGEIGQAAGGAQPTFDQRFAQAPSALSTAGSSAMLPQSAAPSPLMMAAGGAMLPQQSAPSFPSMAGANGFGAGTDMAPPNSMLPPNAAPAIGQGAPAQAPQTAPALFGGGTPNAATPAPSGPGIMDRLTAGATNLTTGGNPLAGLLNSVSGLATGQRTDKMGIMLNQQRVTMQAVHQALVAGGTPPDQAAALAQAAALNPEVMKTLAPLLASKPVYQKTGTDPLTGQDSGIFIDVDKKQITPALNNGVPVGPGGQPQQGTPPSVQALFDNIEHARGQGATQQDMLQLVPNSIRGGVDAMLNGKAIPTNLSQRGQARDLTIRTAHAIDPNFDETLIPQRVAFAHQMAQTTPNSAGGQKILLNTSLQHLAELADSYVKIHNTDGVLPSALPGSDFVARTQNAIANSSNAQAGNAAFISDTAQKLSGEVGKLYSGASGGGEAERQATANRFSPNISPQAAIGALQASKKLVLDKMDALQSQRDQVYGSTGENVYPILNPQTKQALERIDTAIARLQGGQTATAQQGQQQAPQQITEGATATNPKTGQRIMFKGGQWQPLQ